MNTGSITIIREADNRYSLTLRLPVAWLSLFEQLDDAVVWGERVSRMWGQPEAGPVTANPMRRKQDIYTTLPYTEKVQSELLTGISALKRRLKEQERYETVLNLEPDQETLQWWSRNTNSDNDRF